MFLDVSSNNGYNALFAVNRKGTVMSFGDDVERAVPSIERIQEVVAYDPDEGTFTWRIARARRFKPGQPAGKPKHVRKGNGEKAYHLYIGIDGCQIPASRIAWVLQHGRWPEGKLQTRDGNPMNLRFDNLREPISTVTETAFDGTKKRVPCKAKQQEYGLMRYYGMTMAEYAEMFHTQNGVCAICGKPEDRKANGKVRPMPVDHCHTTGAIRGLLCSFCNSVLGQAKDDIGVLRAAIRYLEKHAAKAESIEEKAS